ncbi:YutD family protein [Lysinibacillus sp. M3]|uniref:YutD family protein n=1 Tax=Lysinibacillus zambalensis TaxID=3160866 RepID=A0ABV1MWR8_9BACI
MITIEGYEYELINDYREAFEEEVFKERYSDILARYDYIVGDWGYNQLRLKGFFDDKNQKATFDTKISTLQDYLYEYCNFGCAYFVLRKTGKSTQQPVAVVSEDSQVTKLAENEQIAE